VTTESEKDHILNVFFGPSETEEEAEARIRESLRQAGVGPGGPPIGIPPMPAYLPTVPPQPGDDGQEPGEDHDEGFSDWWRAKRAALRQAQAPATDDAEDDGQDDEAPARAANDRLPDWRDANKPHLADLDEDQEDEPEPRGPRPSRRRVSKTDSSDDEPDQDEDDEDEGGAGEEQLKRRRWSRPALGRPPGLPPKRQSLIQWWREDVKPEHKFLLYHGTGLGAGVYFGVFTYGTRGAEFVTQKGLNNLEADVTLGLLGLVLFVDYRVRHLFPPLAWLVRAVSTSLILGAAWNGTPLADLTN
jgi:hypothetical protein